MSDKIINYIESDPDFPVPFGYKNSWLCVKAGSPEEVIEKLGLKNPVAANWDRGVEMAYNGFDFVSPVLDGYVLVVGYGTDILTLAPDLLDMQAKKFPELQYYVTNRVTEYHAWVRYVNGEMVRGYGYSGCDGTVIINKGDITEDEKMLGLGNLIQNDDDDPDSVNFPDEESVIEMAGMWGIDPGFTVKDYPKSTGYICK